MRLNHRLKQKERRISNGYIHGCNVKRDAFLTGSMHHRMAPRVTFSGAGGRYVATQAKLQHNASSISGCFSQEIRAERGRTRS